MNIRKSYEYDYIEEVYEEKVYNYRILLINDETNHFGYVEDNLMVICFKTKREAKAIAIEAHLKGSAVRYQGSLEECEKIFEKLSDRTLTVTLDH